MSDAWRDLVTILDGCGDNATLSDRTSLIAAVVTTATTQYLQQGIAATYRLTHPSAHDAAATLAIRFSAPVRASMSMFNACAIAIGPRHVRDMIAISDCEWTVEFFVNDAAPAETKHAEPILIMMTRARRTVILATPEEQRALVPVPPSSSSSLSQGKRRGTPSILQRLGVRWPFFGAGNDGFPCEDDDENNNNSSGDDDDATRPSRKRPRLS